MKSILFIHQSAELYGSDKTILMFISSLDKQKYKSIVVLPFDGPLKTEFEKNGIEVIIAPVLKLYRKMFTPKNIVKFFSEHKQGLKKLEELHKKYKFDIVYSHTLASLIGIVFAKKNKIKHLWHVQEIIAKPKLFNKGFVKLLLMKSNNVAVYDSKTTMDFWIKGNKKLAQKSEFVCNGLDVKQKPEPNPADVKIIRNQFFNVDKNELVIALVGRINSWKGQQLLLEAFNKIAPKYNTIKLVFIGSAPPNQEFFETDLKDKIQKYNLIERVIIIPFQENIWRFWDAIDIAVVPSTEPEPFGMVAIEAMLSKKPVIAANHGGLTETVVHEYNGLLFTPNSSDALANCLEELINNEEKRKLFGENGYERTINHFSLEKHVEKFESIFNKM
ncbi:glycosyltransferase family 4 protein [Flavobacterium orientale]|uniref:Glycosyl transferase n=1 Tax=Flavobacterium orientale TaxID=1756020 RepID=A0A916XZ21_9FLAO|nr:glycosyltransferase family 4 protein [Flavobacterium orientale]GGD22702.1 glycosyl transferase [Flavobacterium orientale]